MFCAACCAVPPVTAGMLGITRPFLTELVDTVIHENKAGYPELEEHADYIKKVIGTEEERFYKTIDQGMTILNGLIDNITKAAVAGNEKILSVATAFKLNDTNFKASPWI